VAIHLPARLLGSPLSALPSPLPHPPILSSSLHPSRPFLRADSGRNSRYDPGAGINEATIIKKRNFILTRCVRHSAKFYYAADDGVGEKADISWNARVLRSVSRISLGKLSLEAANFALVPSRNRITIKFQMHAVCLAP